MENFPPNFKIAQMGLTVIHDVVDSISTSRLWSEAKHENIKNQ